MTDDLTRMRAKRIALAQTPDQIREAIRKAAQFCPACGVLLRQHTDGQLDECAVRIDDSPRGA